jgi:DNA invertase Pin-like site-specific DNA recombinase
MTRVAIYARFSTDLQRDVSTADQQRVCAQLAEKHAPGCEIRYFSDEGKSAASLFGRPGIQALLQAARAREFGLSSRSRSVV